MDNYDKSFDWDDCLASSHNKVDLARELLSMFTKELPTFRDQINQAYQQEDQEKMTDLLHKLNGACCYCGVPKLKKIVDEFEFTLKQKSGMNISPYIDELNKEIEKLMVILENHKK